MTDQVQQDGRGKPAASRRAVLLGAGAAALAPASPIAAQPPPGAGRGPGRGGGAPPTAEQLAAALPLNTPGLEHFGTLVPDVAAASLFWGKVFNNELFKERQGALRTYVCLRLGPTAPPLSYMAIGAAGDRPAQIDHICALTERGSNTAAINARLEQLGSQGRGRAGTMDPEGIQLQLLGAPGGLAGTIIPADKMTTDPPIFTPLGLRHHVLHVGDVDKAIAYYQAVFAGRLTRPGPDRAWIDIRDTRLGLYKGPAGERPKVYNFGVKVAAFNRADAARRLQALGAVIVPTSGDEARILRFTAPFGITADVVEA